MSNHLPTGRAAQAALASAAAIMFSCCLPAVAEDPLEAAREEALKNALENGPSGVRFERDVRPILKAHCFHCHGEEPELAGGLDLRLVRSMRAGGDSGPAIEAGQPDDSLLLARIVSGEMPPSGKRLSDDEQTLVAAWIAQGTLTAREEPDDPAQVKFTEEELAHWAFQPPRKPSLPALYSGTAERALQPIDAFIAAGLQSAGLGFAPPAERAALLRRLKFDLHGLPPTAEEREQFLSDTGPAAYERLVDRLLASPQYGVRWARHWLDVVGYAESDGNVTNDQPRPHAWHYRDYVIHAFNNDKPYDQFLIEQLAGDELIEGSPDGNNLRHVELLAATGLLRMAPDVTQTENGLLDRNQAVAEVIDVVGTGLLGVTVGCAQCHDHRYDPVSIEDYYRLRAVFDPAFQIHQWKQPAQRLIDLTDDETRAAAAAIEAQAVVLQEDINQRRREHCQSIQEREIARVPSELQEAIRTAVNTKPSERTDEQKQLLDRYPTVRTIDWIVGQLVEYDNKAHSDFQAEEKKVAELRGTKPLQRLIMAVSESRDAVPTSSVFFRGSPESPTVEVQPHELTPLVSTRGHVSVPALADATSRTTGRRLAYARQLTDGTHPTVARVIVNRVWLHHFGRGLVNTPGDFGLNGEAPSHPELLDWLAVDLMEHGWSLKRLHKQILMTQAYQQAAIPGDPLAIDVDRDNRLLSRAALRRLDAESMRDAILQVSGQLNLTLGGPSVPVTEDGEGKAVLGTQNRLNGLFESVSGAGEGAYRRSLFIATLRSLPLNELQTFDLPELKPNCQVRDASTVAQQALFFMNDQFIVDASMRMAESLAVDGADETGQVQQAFVRLFSCLPTDGEVAACSQFLATQAETLRTSGNEEWRKQLADRPELAARAAMASLCQTLLSSNRFLYVQ
jgi:mono/diheme cytochrome c family protein